MAVDVIVGLQWGDEGKGRWVDDMAADYQIVARKGGGNNAGHTVNLPDGRVLQLHMVPSGISHEGVVNVIGNGTLVNPAALSEEINALQANGIEVTADNLKLSSAAHLILPHHISEDEVRELGSGAQGSTKKGIAQAAADKSLRVGVRAESLQYEPLQVLQIVFRGLRRQRLLRQQAGLETLGNEWQIARQFLADSRRLGAFVTDTVVYLNERLKHGDRVLAEGAQAAQLDLDHGMYPYVTSTTTTSGGAAVGLGIAPQHINKVYGVIKAVQSRVGNGPFVTEFSDPELLQNLHGDMDSIDAERGTTTGRIRRLGALDLPQIRRAIMVNGATELYITKLDWLNRMGDTIPICVAYEIDGQRVSIAPSSARELAHATAIYEHLPGWCEDISTARNPEDLPPEANNFLDYLQKELGVTISRAGVGPGRAQVVTN